jgi:hypothetical protein
LIHYSYSGRYSPQTLVELRDDQWRKLLRNIAVEVIVLQTAGRDVNQIWYPRPNDQHTFDISHTLRLQPGKDGASVLSSSNNAAEAIILKAIPERIEAMEGQLPIHDLWRGSNASPSSNDWLQVGFTDVRAKLAVSATFSHPNICHSW